MTTLTDTGAAAQNSVSTASNRVASEKRQPVGNTSAVRWVSTGLPFVVPVLLLAIWELSSRFGSGSGALPAPEAVAIAMWRWMFGEPKSSMDLYSGTWLSQVLASALRVFIGFSLASSFGIALGLVTGASRVGFYLFDHVIQSVRCVPAPAWVPFSVVWFGIGNASSIPLIALVAFFPVAINTAGGVQNVRPILRDAAAMLGSSRLNTWWRVLLPGALPFIFVGLRLAIGMAWIAVVVSELVGVREGLGYTLFQSYQFGRMDIMICTMFTLGAVGLLSDRLMSYLGQKFTYRS